jgi:S1-C subfamily serine protease
MDGSPEPREKAADERADARHAAAGLGDYRVIEEISSGPDSIVFKAHQKSLGRTVALKVFLTGRAPSEEEVQRFIRKATAASALEHANLVPIYEVGEARGRPFIAMGFVEGRSLGKRVGAEGPLPHREAADLMKQVAETLHYVHSQGVVHRNLSPDTLMLNARGRPRLIVHGSARRFGIEQTATVRGTAPGLPGFNAPELEAGGQADVGPSVDIYALGAVHFYAMTGRPPSPDLLSRPAPRSGSDPTVGVTGLPRDLEKICRKCLRTSPRARYATAAEVADDLGRWLRGERIVWKPKSSAGLIGDMGVWLRGVPASVTGLLQDPRFVKRAFQGAIAVVTTSLAIYLLSNAFRKPGSTAPPSPASQAKNLAPDKPEESGRPALSKPEAATPLGGGETAKAEGAAAAPTPPQAPVDAFANVTKGQTATALVDVNFGVGQAHVYGTAFCVDRSGLFVTNAHVVEASRGAAPAQVSLVLRPGQKDQETVPARVVRSNADTDLALLQADRGAIPAPLELGRVDGLVETMEVTTFGFPFGPALMQNDMPRVTVNVPKISRLQTEGGRLKRIQLDGPLFPGHSGGPVLNRDGKVIAVIVAKVREGTGLNFAVPANDLTNFLAGPEVTFDPPALAGDNMQKPFDWTIGVKPSPVGGSLVPRDIQVYVRVSAEGSGERIYQANQDMKGSFAVTISLPPGFVRPTSKALAATVEVMKGSDLLTKVDRQIPLGATTLAQATAAPGVDLGPNPAVCMLPGPVHDVAVAGGGGYLLLVIKAARQLVVYEAAGNRLTKSIPLLDDTVQVAGGESKFVLLYPTLSVLQRFDLATLERDLERNLPPERRSVSIALGSHSQGPILWAWIPDPTRAPASKKTSRPPAQPNRVAQQSVWFSFIDLDELKEIKLQSLEAPDPRQFNKIVVSRGVGTFRSTVHAVAINNAGNVPHSLASASGELFAFWTWPVLNLVSVHKKGAGYVARLVSLHNTDQPPYLPGPDGRSVLLRSKKVLDQNGREITPAAPQNPNVPVILLVLPTADPALTLHVRQSSRMVAQRPQAFASVSVVLPGGKELLTIDELPELSKIWTWSSDNNQERLTRDKRFTFDTASQRLLVIPPENDGIVSRKLDLEGAFNRLGGAPVVTSPTLLWATSGQEFRHQIKARSRAGGLKFRLSGTLAPPGLSVASDGVVTWKVPPKSSGTEVTAVVTIRDAAGQETTSALKILVR